MIAPYRAATYRRDVLDHGSVQLLDWMGDDLRIVNAAQASLDNESLTYEDRERGILRFLMREEHGVPFEHVLFTFKMRMPLFLCAQFKKHRMASWSEQSGRYDEFEDPKFYVPMRERVRTQVGKPGNYTFKLVDPMTAQLFTHELDQHNLQSVKHYRWALEAGVAKEQARLFLPPGLFTTVVWTLNVRSLFNVVRLRADTHAQWEAQQYGVAFEELARLVIPDTINAYVAAGRPKP